MKTQKPKKSKKLSLKAKIILGLIFLPIVIIGIIPFLIKEYSPLIFGKPRWSQKPLSQEDKDKLLDFTDKLGKKLDEKEIERLKKEREEKLNDIL